MLSSQYLDPDSAAIVVQLDLPRTLSLHFSRLKNSLLPTKRDILFDDHFFDLLASLPIEWVFADYHGVHKDSQRPNVYLRIAGIVSLQELWTHVFNTSGIMPFSYCTAIGAENTEIRYLGMYFRWGCLCRRKFINFFKKYDVLEFYVSMDYSSVMAIV